LTSCRIVPLEPASMSVIRCHMAEHFEPPDPNYRQWATGAVLLELHSITGAWDEFRSVLLASPELAADVLGWICPEDDWQYASVEKAKRIAAELT
jgi:hypothetical protein